MKRKRLNYHLMINQNHNNNNDDDDYKKKSNVPI